MARPSDPVSYTPYFSWKHGEIYCEGAALRALAARNGTPTYVYSKAAMRAAYLGLDRALGVALGPQNGESAHRVCYAVKANSNLSVLREFAKLGSGFDIVSGGELERLRRIGVRGERIVFSGVGKTRDEIAAALKTGIFLFNVESAEELDALEREAARLRIVAPAALRVNPDVSAGAHPHIATGKYQHKFGVDWRNARELYLARRGAKWISWKGISAHIGSQVLSVGPYKKALRRLVGYVGELRRAGIPLRCFDIGGGLGVRYTNERPPTFRKYAETLASELRVLGCTVLVEPGRAMVAQAGVLLMRVLYTKQTGGKTFVVADAAMNDFIRAALYDATHPITSVVRPRNSRHIPDVAVVGPVCETGDVFLNSWPVGNVSAGDVLALWGAGAYGFAQASNYNSRLRPTEVMVSGTTAKVIRKRETVSQMLRDE